MPNILLCSMSVDNLLLHFIIIITSLGDLSTLLIGLLHRLSSLIHSPCCSCTYFPKALLQLFVYQVSLNHSQMPCTVLGAGDVEANKTWPFHLWKLQLNLAERCKWLQHSILHESLWACTQCHGHRRKGPRLPMNRRRWYEICVLRDR